MRKTMILCLSLVAVALLGCSRPEPKVNPPASAPGQESEPLSMIPTVEVPTPAPERMFVDVTEPRDYDQPVDRIVLKGTADPSVAKIVVSYKNDDAGLSDEYTLSKFTKGDSTWEYVADTRYSNWADRLNSYTVKAYGEAGALLQEKEVHFFRGVKPEGVGFEPTMMEPTKGLSLKVDFLPAPEKLNGVDFFKSLGYKGMTSDALSDGDRTVAEIYKEGVVKSDPYAGMPLLLWRSECDYPFCSYNALRMIQRPDQSLVVLGNYSNIGFEDFKQGAGSLLVLRRVKIAWDVSIAVPTLDSPDDLLIPSLGFTLRKSEVSPVFVSEAQAEKLYTDPKTGIQLLNLTNTNCPIVPNVDGTFTKYNYSVDLRSDNGKGVVIHWQDGSETQKDYVTPEMGCGGSCVALVKDAGVLSRLVPAGKAETGVTVYTEPFTSDELKAMKTDYDMGGEAPNRLVWLYRNTNIGNPAPTLQEFYKMRPYIFVKDPFGRMVELDNVEYAPMAECGKPVIYLYPEVDADVSVQVRPTGGFTKTEPAYGEGWMVRATPESQLTNYADSKSYPYLFWEGKALGYEMSRQGFVVARNEVEPFLREKLAYQGMNEKEIADFMEFWVPHMQAKPYYFVTFVPQSEFDQMAPLQVKPRPDTIIRVFMDFKALERPIVVEPQVLIPRERKGFTVVEWGGELRD